MYWVDILAFAISEQSLPSGDVPPISIIDLLDGTAAPNEAWDAWGGRLSEFLSTADLMCQSPYSVPLNEDEEIREEDELKDSEQTR